MGDSGGGCDALINRLFEVKSFSFVGHDDRNSLGC
jgi:hypothetical protein